MPGRTVGDAGDRCPECAAPLTEVRVQPDGAVVRASCLGCGLQLVRRGEGDWAEIRG